MKIGDKVNVYELSAKPDRRMIGQGYIDEIEPNWKGFDGPMAAVRIPGQAGRYLRAISELSQA